MNFLNVLLICLLLNLQVDLSSLHFLDTDEDDEDDEDDDVEEDDEDDEVRVELDKELDLLEDLENDFVFNL